MSIPLERAQELLASDVTSAEEQVAAIDDRLGALRTEMQDLKVALYGRFGKSINLEA